MSGEQELEETGGDLDGRRTDVAPLSAAAGGCQCQASPTGAAQSRTRPPVSSPRAVFGAELFLQSRKVKGVRILWFLFCWENSRDNPFISSGLMGEKLFAYKWEALDNLHRQVPTQCQCSRPNCVRFEITFAGDHVRTAVP